MLQITTIDYLMKRYPNGTVNFHLVVPGATKDTLEWNFPTFKVDEELYKSYPTVLLGLNGRVSPNLFFITSAAPKNCRTVTLCAVEQFNRIRKNRDNLRLLSQSTNVLAQNLPKVRLLVGEIKTEDSEDAPRFSFIPAYKDWHIIKTAYFENMAIRTIDK